MIPVWSIWGPCADLGGAGVERAEPKETLARGPEGPAASVSAWLCDWFLAQSRLRTWVLAVLVRSTLVKATRLGWIQAVITGVPGRPR